MNSEELVQSIGILAFVCPLALGPRARGQRPVPRGGRRHLVSSRSFPRSPAMYVGMRLRRRLAAAIFMKWFFPV